jgi:hypothetical protein
MATNNQDELARAYTMLSSLRKNVAEMTEVAGMYVQEFHAVLDRLEKADIDVTEFRISGRAMYFVGGRSYVDKPFILTKLDALLGYFEIIAAEKPRSIGFHPPENK